MAKKQTTSRPVKGGKTQTSSQPTSPGGPAPKNP